MERASQSELLWAYAITRDEYAKMISEESLFIYEIESMNLSKVLGKNYDPKENRRCQAVVEKDLCHADDHISLEELFSQCRLLGFVKREPQNLGMREKRDIQIQTVEYLKTQLRQVGGML